MNKDNIEGMLKDIGAEQVTKPVEPSLRHSAFAQARACSTTI